MFLNGFRSFPTYTPDVYCPLELTRVINVIIVNLLLSVSVKIIRYYLKPPTSPYMCRAIRNINLNLTALSLVFAKILRFTEKFLVIL